MRSHRNRRPPQGAPRKSRPRLSGRPRTTRPGARKLGPVEARSRSPRARIAFHSLLPIHAAMARNLPDRQSARRGRNDPSWTLPAPLRIRIVKPAQGRCNEMPQTSRHRPLVAVPSLRRSLGSRAPSHAPAEGGPCSSTRAAPPRRRNPLAQAARAYPPRQASSTVSDGAADAHAPLGSTRTTRTTCPARRRRFSGRFPPTRMRSPRRIWARGMARSPT